MELYNREPFGISYFTQHNYLEISSRFLSVSVVCFFLLLSRAFQVVLVVKKAPANAGDIRDVHLIPGSRRSGGGHEDPLQYSYLKNPMDRGAWLTK